MSTNNSTHDNNNTHGGRRGASLVGFFVAAAFVSGLGFLPMVWASYAGAGRVPGFLLPLQFLMLFGPGLLAVIWAAREGGRRAVGELLRGLLSWRAHPAWYAAVLFGPLAINLAALLGARALGFPVAPLPTAAGAAAAFVPAFGAYLLLNTEELAWRGYAWPRLRDRLGLLRGSLLLGLIWGVLHAPLFALKGGHPGGWPPLLFLQMTVAFGVIFSVLYERTGGSILLAHLLHQSLNAWGDAVPVYPRVNGSLAPALLMVAVSVCLAALGVLRARRDSERAHADALATPQQAV